MSDEPYVDPASIPELATILRLRLLSRVRVFEAWCPKGDRLAQVVLVRGRPLALSRGAVRGVTMSPAGNSPGRLAHRDSHLAMWLDLDPMAYYLPADPPQLDGPAVRLHPFRLPAECRHERLSLPGDWLREQVAAGVEKRVVDNATRFEMGARFRGE
jgi:hypothetical protein